MVWIGKSSFINLGALNAGKRVNLREIQGSGSIDEDCDQKVQSNGPQFILASGPSSVVNTGEDGNPEDAVITNMQQC